MDRLTPSETVGAEGWAALAAFADVADLVEIVGSTAELVVSVEVGVEVDSSGQRQQSRGGVDVQDEETGTEARGPRALESEGSESRAGPLRQGKRLTSDENENELSSAGENETTGSWAARNDSGDRINSREAGSVEGDTAVSLAEEGEEQRHTRTLLSSTESDRANQRGDLPLLSNDKGVRAARLAAPTPGHSTTLGEAAESAVPQSGERRRSSSNFDSPELVAINEEADTDVETCSDSDSEDEEQGGREEEDEKSRNAESEPSRGSLGAVDQSDTILVDTGRAEAAGDGDTSDRETDGPECAGGVVVSKVPAVTARARIILGPSTIEQSLAIEPLSAFVLQAARRMQHADLKTWVPDSVHHADGCGCSSSLGNATGARSAPDMAYLGVAEKQDDVGLASVIDIENKQGRPVVCPATSVDPKRPHVDDLPRNPPTSPPTDKTSPGYDVPDAEKLGLACAVETLILPRVRLSLTSKRRQTPLSSERRTVIRLRLDTPIDPLQRVSKPEGMAAPPPATQEPAAGAAGADGAAGAAPPPSTEATAVATARRPLSAGVTPGLEDKLFCTRRYIKNPVNRWVGRVDGCRCLLSCSASPSASTVGWQSGRRGINSNQHGGVEEEARCVSAIFMPGHAVDEGDVSGRSSLEKQQPKRQRFVVFGRVPSVRPPSNSSTLDGSKRSGRRPLCSNCCRRALQRLRVNTSLLAESEATCLALNTPAGADTGNHGWPEVPTGDPRVLQKLRFEAWRQRARNNGVVGKISSPGRLADWACSSGAMLCNVCLGLLREAPLERVMSTS